VSRQYCVAEGIIDRDIGEELLVHRFDTDEVFVLNGHAKVVFQAVKEMATHEEVQEFVATNVFGDTAELYQTVDCAIEQMLTHGIIVPRDHLER
jgi:hypothetical protein